MGKREKAATDRAVMLSLALPRCTAQVSMDVTLGLFLTAASAVAVALFLRRERRRARSVLELAVELEGQREYESACFHYAVAFKAGADRAACEPRIRALWTEHGPFQFRGIGRELRAKYCTYESCGQGYHQLTVDDIRRVVARHRS